MFRNGITALGIGLLSAGLISCSRPQGRSQYQWSASGGGKAPEIAQAEQFKNRESQYLVKSESVERFPQKWGPAEVEGSYLQQISDSTGKKIYMVGSAVDRDSTPYLKTLNSLHLNRFKALEQLKKTDLRLASAAQVFEPKLLIKFRGSEPYPVYQVDFLNHEKTRATRYQFTSEKGVISDQEIGLHFIEVRGVVFPEGPKLSSLTEVPLPGLIGDGTLTGTQVKISEETPDKAMMSQGIFKYEPEDTRFDQVQVYHFANLAFSTFKERLGFTLPFTLEIQTHVGAPEKRNVMTYLHGKVLLGTGDGENWKNIMKDPSVVIHEISHAYVDALARLPFQGEGGSLNEAFADYFTTSFLNNPKLGEVAFQKGPFKRTVENSKTLTDKSGVLYGDSLIVSGTLWEVRTAFGNGIADELAMKTLSRLGPGGDFVSFPLALTDAGVQILDSAQQVKLSEILKARKWL